MPKMSTGDVQTMLAGQKAGALATISAAKLMDERESAEAYYLGDMSQDMPAQDGRSSAVSTDVQDAIEGLLPPLMDIVAGTDEVVRFEPVGPEDEDGAQQETDYVNHVFMVLNDGFAVILVFAKDGLLSKNGFVKVMWEEREEEEKETYYDQSEDQFSLLVMAIEASNGAMKIIEHSTNNEPEKGKEPAEATS